MIHSGCRGPLPCDRDRLPGAIDSEDRTRRGDHFGHQQRNVANATTDIEHPHSRSDAGVAQGIRGEIAEVLALEFQTSEFRFGVTECVGVCAGRGDNADIEPFAIHHAVHVISPRQNFENCDRPFDPHDRRVRAAEVCALHPGESGILHRTVADRRKRLPLTVAVARSPRFSLGSHRA